MDITLKTAPTDYINQVNFIIRMYEETGYSLSHAFQKDAIQNSTGARSNPGKWAGWRCNIDIVENEKGTFLVVEDFGTTGLTGPNYTIDEISEKFDKNESFPEDYRLARISCRNSSGNIKAGAGLFGVGKTLYSAASKEKNCRYYFDSIINNGEYRANINDKNRLIANGALINEEGKNFIFNETGLKPINHVGTRFIICDPKDEIIEAVRSGQMAKDASETWWRILPFFGEDEGIFINGKKLMIPSCYLENNVKSNQSRNYDKQTNIFDGYSAKKYGFTICNELEEQYRGFYFYRRGMKVGRIELPDVPKEIEDKYYGFIELQNDYEEELAKIESSTHYGVLPNKKQNKIYSALRDFVRDFVKDNLVNWGYIKIRENENKKFYKLAKEIQEQVQSMFKNNGFKEIGKGDTKKKYHSGFLDVVFPNPNEDRTVHTGDIIKFKFYIKNHTLIDQNYKVHINIVSCGKISNFYEETILVSSEERFVSKEIKLLVNENNAEKFIDNAIVLSVKPENDKQNEPNKIYFYYEIDTKKNIERDYSIIMSNRNMPRKNDKRVNTGEVISDIMYKMKNNTALETKAVLFVTTHNCENGNVLIEKPFKQDITIKKFSEIDSDSFEINFDPDIYNDKLSKGKILIKAKLVLMEDCGNYEKGDILGEYNFYVFYNRNEKSGIEDSFEPLIVDDTNDHRCSWVDGKQGNRKLFINIGHPEFKLASDEATKEMFIARQMIREFAFIYIKEGVYSVFVNNDPDGSHTSSADLMEIVNRKVDELWWLRCQN